MQDDPQELLRNDLEKFGDLSGDGFDTSLPAMIELGFVAMTTLVLLCWLVMLLWVPDPIDGQQWMGFGMVGLLMFGVPGGLLFILRRGGAAVLIAVIRELTR